MSFAIRQKTYFCLAQKSKSFSFRALIKMEHVYDAWDMTDPRAAVINRCSRNLVLHSTGARTNALCHRDVFVSAISEFPSDNQASTTALYPALQNRPQKASGAKHFAKSLHWAQKLVTVRIFSISVRSKTIPWHWAIAGRECSHAT